MVETQGRLFGDESKTLNPASYDNREAFMKDLDWACTPTTTDKLVTVGSKVVSKAIAFGIAGSLFEGVGAGPGIVLGGTLGVFEGFDRLDTKKTECRERSLAKLSFESWKK